MITPALHEAAEFNMLNSVHGGKERLGVQSVSFTLKLQVQAVVTVGSHLRDLLEYHRDLVSRLHLHSEAEATVI